MGIENNETLSQEVSVLGDYECRHKNTIKHFVTYLESQQTQPQDKTIPYEAPRKYLVLIFFLLKNKTLLCISAYYSRSPNVKNTDSCAADDLVEAKQPRLHLQNLDSPKNSFQKQAQIFHQRCSNNFAGRWTYSGQ